jgi:hypothetical protein
MAITLKAVHPGTQYPWGHQVRFVLTDGREDLNEEAIWPSAPTQAQIDTAVGAAISRHEHVNDAPPPRYRVVCEDGEEVFL